MKGKDYLKLVDQTGRIVVRGKRGRIDPSLEPELQRIGLSTNDWFKGSTQFRMHFRNGDLRLRNVS